MSKENTTNIIDCLDKGPAWINNDDWNQMIKDVWSPLNFKGGLNLLGGID
jgi:hypothetical protein